MAEMGPLEQKLGTEFGDRALLEQALVHSSYINENHAFSLPCNERLEFLGDAVLGLVVAEKLHQDYPQLSEGEMTRLRASLVCRDALVGMARAIGLGDHLLLGKGEEASGGRRKPANLAGAMEAVIAAVYLDQGLAGARGCVLRLLGGSFGEQLNRQMAADYKSRLQELIQARRQVTPEYCLIEAVGPDHLKEFTVEVRVDGICLGRGSGKNKKAAETEAARVALEGLSSGFTG